MSIATTLLARIVGGAEPRAQSTTGRLLDFQKWVNERLASVPAEGPGSTRQLLGEVLGQLLKHAPESISDQLRQALTAGEWGNGDRPLSPAVSAKAAQVLLEAMARSSTADSLQGSFRCVADGAQHAALVGALPAFTEVFTHGPGGIEHALRRMHDLRQKYGVARSLPKSEDLQPFEVDDFRAAVSEVSEAIRHLRLDDRDAAVPSRERLDEIGVLVERRMGRLPALNPDKR